MLEGLQPLKQSVGLDDLSPLLEDAALMLARGCCIICQSTRFREHDGVRELNNGAGVLSRDLHHKVTSDELRRERELAVSGRITLRSRCYPLQILYDLYRLLASLLIPPLIFLLSC